MIISMAAPASTAASLELRKQLAEAKRQLAEIKREQPIRLKRYEVELAASDRKHRQLHAEALRQVTAERNSLQQQQQALAAQLGDKERMLLQANRDYQNQQTQVQQIAQQLADLKGLMAIQGFEMQELAKAKASAEQLLATKNAQLVIAQTTLNDAQTNKQQQVLRLQDKADHLQHQVQTLTTRSTEMEAERSSLQQQKRALETLLGGKESMLMEARKACQMQKAQVQQVSQQLADFKASVGTQAVIMQKALSTAEQNRDEHLRELANRNARLAAAQKNLSDARNLLTNKQHQTQTLQDQVQIFTNRTKEMEAQQQDTINTLKSQLDAEKRKLTEDMSAAQADALAARQELVGTVSKLKAAAAEQARAREQVLLQKDQQSNKKLQTLHSRLELTLTNLKTKEGQLAHMNQELTRAKYLMEKAYQDMTAVQNLERDALATMQELYEAKMRCRHLNEEKQRQQKDLDDLSRQVHDAQEKQHNAQKHINLLRNLTRDLSSAADQIKQGLQVAKADAAASRDAADKAQAALAAMRVKLKVTEEQRAQALKTLVAMEETYERKIDQLTTARRMLAEDVEQQKAVLQKLQEQVNKQTAELRIANETTHMKDVHSQLSAKKDNPIDVYKRKNDSLVAQLREAKMHRNMVDVYRQAEKRELYDLQQFLLKVKAQVLQEPQFPGRTQLVEQINTML